MKVYTSKIDLLKKLQDLVKDGSKLFEALTQLQDDYNLPDRDCLKLTQAYVLLTSYNP